jgi:RNA polymerase sigma-70 factor, ECF subfamily
LSLQAIQTVVGSTPADTRPAAPLEVAELTRRMVNGDELAYRVFYDAYFHRLFRYLLVVAGGDEETAGEALQATLVRVVRHIKVFADEPVFWSWLTVLARSALCDHKRKRRRYLAFLDRFTQHAADEPRGPSDSEADAQLLKHLQHALAALPDDERDLLERKYFGRQSVQAIAGELDTSEKAIESRLVRARRKLKAGVLKELKDESSG